MEDLVSIINPSSLEYFTPDIIIRLFLIILTFELLGAIIETFFKGVR